jgi:hypothetical protein
MPSEDKADSTLCYSYFKFFCISRACLHTAIITALGRLGQEDQEFKASLCYIVRSCLKNNFFHWALVAHAHNPSFLGG